MEYSKIIAITGLPGLFELINSKADGAIVRSLEDKSTRFVSSRIHQFSHLESIEIYTVKDNVNLVTILQAMEGSPEKLPDEKNDAALKKYFETVYGDIDFERVYNSDLKKMVRWYTALKKHDIELKLPEPAEEPVVEEKKPEPKEEPKKEIKEKAKPGKKVKSEKPEAEKSEKKTKLVKAEEKPKKEEKKEKPAAKEKPKAAPKKKAKK